jgi:Flp pilus assembly protein TadG
LFHPTSASPDAFHGDRGGQGLVEFALVAPLLLLLILGTVDLGRGFYYAIGISSAARAAALSASRDPAAAISRAAVRQRVCDETGWVAYRDATACSQLTALEVVCTPNDPTVLVRDPKVTVRVTYRYGLVSFYLAPIIGNPAATTVVVTYEMSNESAVPCNAP